MERKTASGRPHRVAYFLYQPESASRLPVICAHGLTRNSFDFHWLAERLRRLGHPVACYDAPGRAASEPMQDASEYSYPEYGPIGSELAAHLGWPRLHWVGTSMGGIVGMLVASSAPSVALASLVLVDIGPEIDVAPVRRIVSYVGRAPEGGLPVGLAGAEAFVEATFPGMLPVPGGARLRQCAAYLTRPTAGAEAEVEAGEAAGFPRTAADEDDGAARCPNYDCRVRAGLPAEKDVAAMDLWAVWAGCRCGRVTVLRGAESDVLTVGCAERMAVEVPAGVESARVEVTTFSGVGHAPTLWSEEQEDAVVAALAEA